MHTLRFSLSLGVAASCLVAFALPTPVPAAAPSPRQAAVPARDPAALDALLARYDQVKPGPEREALALAIDRHAGQRYATVSRLYWYTDLDAAEAAAQASHRPILALRMLGRLDEDLSCANSRLFRTTLYANTAVAKFLRESFILYWSSERAVPKVTIDFGDGRTIQGTTTGNSAHYVLDERGAVLDVLPGLYAPTAFTAELTKSLALAKQIARLEPQQRVMAISRYHEAAAQTIAKSWAAVAGTPYLPGQRALLTQADVDSVLALAQRATYAKAYIEVPQLRAITAGTDPGEVSDAELALWAAAGQKTWNIGGPITAPVATATGTSLGAIGMGFAAKAEPNKPVPLAAPLLDDRSRALITRLHTSGGMAATAAQLATVIARLGAHRRRQRAQPVQAPPSDPRAPPVEPDPAARRARRLDLRGCLPHAARRRLARPPSARGLHWPAGRRRHDALTPVPWRILRAMHRAGLVSITLATIAVAASPAGADATQIGAYFGPRLYSDDSRLGYIEDAPGHPSLQNGIQFGLRVARPFFPWLVPELELTFSPTDTTREAGAMPVSVLWMEPRFHLRFEALPGRRFQPFFVIGGGAPIVLSSARQTLDSGITAEAYVGAGVRFETGRSFALRVDGRVSVLPGIERYFAPEIDITFGIELQIGRESARKPTDLTPTERPDRDSDGIVDATDACVDRAEDADGFDDLDGCPDIDNDLDRVLDIADRCASVPETSNGYDDDDGCPDTVPLEVDSLRGTVEGLLYADGETIVRDSAQPNIQKIAKIMAAHPTIKVVLIGHTDNKEANQFATPVEGGPPPDYEALAVDLSKARAESVKQALVSAGVAAPRVEIVGRGSEDPVSDNDRPKGRLANRRVEIKLFVPPR